VDILGPDGVRLGRGLTRYTATEATAIRGRHSRDIEGVLGYPGRAALIHRDDMVTT
jgi:glutamate 5-kinase